MKKITLLFFMLCSLAGYSQLALEDFESGVWPPASWNILNVQGIQQQWAQGSTATGNPVHSPTHSAFMQRENVPDGTSTEDFLVTKPFTLPANSQIRFWCYTTIAGNQGNTYKVMILPPTGDVNNPLDYVLLQSYTEPQLTPSAETWTLNTVSATSNATLAGYAGQSVRIAFVMMGDQGDRWALDDIEVVSECIIPATLAATNIGLTSATLSWTNPSGATAWEVEIVAATAAPTGVGQTVTSNPFNVTGLTSSTCYKYYVRAKCTDTNLSPWAGPFNFCTVAEGATCAAPIVIGALPYSASNNTANFGDHFDGSPGTTGCGTTNGYLNGDDVVYAYTATANGVISINASGLGDFAGLFVYNSCANIGVSCIGGGTGNLASPISIPSLSVTAGTTYYVVISTWATPQSTPYNLVIQQVNCAPPVGLPTTGIGQTSANLSWTNPSSATSWQVVVQAPGGGIPPGVGTTATTNTNYLADGLTPSTPYEYWVRAACGNGTFSAWAGPYLFNTTICEAADQCNYSFLMTDSWGDGWNGNTMTVSQNGITIATIGSTFTTGLGPVTVSVPVCDDLPIQLFWNNGGSFAGEVGVSIQNNFGQTIYTKPSGTGSQNSVLYTGMVDCETPLCLPPSGLSATDITMTTATLNWAGPATGNWDYYVVTAGSPAPTAATPGVNTTTKPVTVTNLTAATNYQYYVRIVCDATNSSGWAGPFNFNTTICQPTEQCVYSFVLTDSFGDGWNGNTMTIAQNGIPVATIGSTFTTGAGPVTVNVPLCDNQPFTLFWNAGGSFAGEVGVSVVNNFGQQLFTKPSGTGAQNTLLYTGNVDCDTPACLAPTGLTATNITTTTALLGWAGPATGNWEYYVVPAGDPAPTATTTGISATTNPVTATDLTAATNYQYYVRVVCSATQNSAWAGPFAFNTKVCEEADQCNYVMVLTDSFGDGWNGARVTVTQAGVPVAVIGSTFTTGQGPIMVNVPMCPGVPFEVTWTNGGSFPGEVGIAMLTPFAEDIFTKAPGTGTPGMVLYSGASASCTPPLCPKPQMLAVNPAEIEETSVEISWNEMGTATSWEVVVLPPGSPEPTVPGTIVTENPYTITGLTSGTSYVVYIRAICGGDDGNSSWTGPLTFTTAIENDDCADAAVLPVNPGALCVDSVTGTLTGATSSGVQSSCSWMMPEWDVWYSFVATGDTHAVSVSGAVGVDLDVAIYGDACGALTEVDCTFDTQLMATGLVAGETYYVQVYSTWFPNPTAPTSFEICIQTPEPPITVSSTQYTVEELVTDVFIDSECATITNIISNTGTAVGQNGIGYFDKNGSSFPFENGIVLVSGNAETDVPGPNDFTISVPWPGWDNEADEAELEAATGLLPGEAHDGTSIQFDFEPLVNMPLTFDFIFASEEYGTPSFECTFSDAFAFILTDLVTNESVNLAVLPGTNIPITVTNVHLYNDICGEANPTLFDQYNGMLAPINFNGQMVPITAVSPYTLTANHPYRMKMIVANKGDHSLSSAVFLLGGSFSLGSINLGVPKLEFLGTAACDGETVVLDTELDPEVYDFEWSVGGVVIPGETDPVLEVTEPGLYSIKATFEGTDCFAQGTIRIEYFDPIEEITNEPNDLRFCDASGFHSFDLESNTPVVMDGVTAASTFSVTYHLTQEDANNDVGALTSPFTNTTQYEQTIWMRIESVSGCVGIKSFAISVDDFTPQFSIPEELVLCGDSTGIITVDPDNFDINSPNVTFVWTLDGGAPLPDNDASIEVTGPGVYQVTISDTGCTATATTTVVVSPTPSAAISYLGSPYCSNGGVASVTHSGNLGGAYSSADGLSIDAVTGEINLGASVAGTYTVTYSIEATPTCDAFTTTTQVVVTALPEAVFTYDSASFCQNASIATPTYDGAAGPGTFEVEPAGLSINPATGVIDPATSDEGTYTVTNKIAAANGCPEVTHSVTVTINPAPIGTFSYGSAAYCQDEETNPSPILAGEAGTFSATPAGLSIDPATGIIDLANSTAGSYTVSNTVPATPECDEVTSTTTVVISATPVFTIVGGCENNVYSLTVIPAAGTFDASEASYSWQGPSGLVDSGVGVFSIVPAVEGTYTVTVSTASSCVDVQSYPVDSTSCFIQRGISPGDSDKNNEFDLSALDVKYLSIFNRYGQEVYSRSNYTKEWVGQDKKGNELPTGTYFYSIERENGETKTGWVYINRQN